MLTVLFESDVMFTWVPAEQSRISITKTKLGSKEYQ